MADDALTLSISAKTDEFVKKVEDAKIKVRSLAMQMSEIDKQMKTESVDRVQKLSEKLDLAKRASEMAAKEAELYADKIKKMTEKHEDASKMTDKQKETLLKLSEQMATAQQKANTYAAEVNKLEKEYQDSAFAAKEAENATENLADSMNEATSETKTLSAETEKSSNNAKNFFDKLKEGVAVNIVSAGLLKIGNFFESIAQKALNAAKAVVSFAKNYAVEAVDLAADYADALGYSEQVFDEQAEAVQKWVKDNSVALRINKSDLQEYVNSMGSLYRSFGMTSEEAAKYSESLVKLATDLRAATGDDTKQIIESLTSVMTGGYQSGYKYGVVINEAAIKAKALSMGLADVAVDEYKVEKARINLEKATKRASEATVKYGENTLEAQEAQLAVEAAAAEFENALGGQTLALTQAQKEAAIYALVMEQTAHLQGQGARESGSYKSQLDALHTTFENLHISVGEKLLPAFNGVVTEFNKFIESEEGEAFLDGIVESVGNLSDKVLEFVESGKLAEWFNNVKEKLPEITEKISTFTQKTAELIPQVFELTEKIIGFADEIEKFSTKTAWSRAEGMVQQFANNYDTSLTTVKSVVQSFADEHGISVAEVYNNWVDYEPQIAEKLSELQNEFGNNETAINAHLAAASGDVQKFCSDVQATDTSGISGFVAKVAQIFSDGVAGWNAILSGNLNLPGQISSPSQWIKNWWDNTHRASGGPVRAGRMYQVNDDHARRREMFIPAVDGYILNGNDTQRVINNSTNNSRTYGDVNVYVNSYGADAASIADEIGAAVNQKLRMAGAW